MFVTFDQDEEKLASAFTSPGMRRWRSVLLEAPLSLLLVVWRSYEDGLFQYQRAILWSNAKLLDLIADVGFSGIRHVYYILPQDDGGLQFVDIVKLKVTQAADTGNLTIVMEDENGGAFGETGGGPAEASTSLVWVLPKARNGSDVIVQD